MAEPLESTLRGPHGAAEPPDESGSMWGLLETLDEVAFVFNNKGWVLHASSNSRQLTGLAARDIMGTRFAPPAFPRDFLLLLRLRVAEVFQTQAEVSFEYSLPVSGEERWYSWRLRHLRTPVAEVVMCFVRDVDSYHHAREMEHLLFNSLIDGYVVLEQVASHGRPDYRYIMANPAFEAQIGLPSSAILGKTITQLQPETEPNWFEAYDRVISSSSATTIRHFAKDQGKHYEAQVFPLGGMRCAVIYRDVSPWYQAQEELRHERDTTERIMELSPIGICIFDSHGHVSWANPRAENMLRTTPPELLSLNIGAGGFRLVDEQGWPVPDDTSVFRRIIRSGQPVYGECVRISDHQGNDRFLSINGSPILSDTGRIESVVMTIEDISDRKQYESSLEKNLREKLVLIHEMNHRVKNNLAVILGMVHMHRQGCDAETGSFVEALESRIYAIGLLHGMLFNPESSSGSEPIRYLELLLKHIEEGYSSERTMIRAELEGSGLSLSPDLLNALGLIINELVTNSIKYAFPDNSSQHQVLVHLGLRGTMLRLTVSDNGRGYPSHMLAGQSPDPATLEPLETGAGTVKDRKKGKGMTLVFLLVSGLGGQIRLGYSGSGGAETLIEFPYGEGES